MAALTTRDRRSSPAGGTQTAGVRAQQVVASPMCGSSPVKTLGYRRDLLPTCPVGLRLVRHAAHARLAAANLRRRPLPPRRPPPPGPACSKGMLRAANSCCLRIHSVAGLLAQGECPIVRVGSGLWQTNKPGKLRVQIGVQESLRMPINRSIEQLETQRNGAIRMSHVKQAAPRFSIQACNTRHLGLCLAAQTHSFGLARPAS